MAIEVGKNRLEALGEVEESADLLRYYAQTMEDNDGYDHAMGNLGDATVHTRSVLRPHGVFAVISPFNFPMALAGGPTGGRARWPATRSSSSRPARRRCRRSTSSRRYSDAGVPDGRDQPRHGPGRHGRRRRSRTNPGIDGIVFTGSYEVGMRAVPELLEGAGRGRASSRWAARTRRSCRARPTSRRRPRGSCAARSASAARSARPTRGSTSSGRSTTSSSGCSSRRPRRSTIGDPLVRANWLGPVIDQRAVERHQQAVAEARRDGAVFIGGEHLTDGDLARGFYVEPTVVGNLPDVAPPVPRRAVRPVHGGRRGRLDRRGARRLANDTSTA